MQSTTPLVRPRFVRSIAVALALCLPLSCDDAGTDKADAKADAKTGDGAKVEGDAAKSDGAAKADDAPPPAVPAEVKTFAKEQSDKACEMLTAEMAAEVLGVPAGELTQRKIMGCIYTWESGDEQAQASLMSIHVAKTLEDADRWFTNATKSRTKEEIAAQMAEVTAKAKAREEIDTKVKEDATDMIGSAITGMTPDEGFRYEDVPGVGDAARTKVDSGDLYVRVGNMQFTVKAYKGPKPPPPENMGNSRDMQQVIAAAKKAEQAHLAETIDVRRDLAKKLAEAIVAAL